MLQLHPFIAQIPANTTTLSTEWFPVALAGIAHIARSCIALGHRAGCTRYEPFAYSFRPVINHDRCQNRWKSSTPRYRQLHYTTPVKKGLSEKIKKSHGLLGGGRGRGGSVGQGFSFYPPVPVRFMTKRKKASRALVEAAAAAAADPGFSRIAVPADRSSAPLVGLLPEAAQLGCLLGP